MPTFFLFAFYASAEMGCHLALGWPMPARILDLFCEFRNATNGLTTVAGSGLLGALAAYGLDGIGAHEKDGMRDLILRGGPWSPEERRAILDYCETDVDALARLLPAMFAKGHVDLPRALLRGRYMGAVAAMEHNGVPIDTAYLARLRTHWGHLQDRLIADIDSDYGVYDGRTFKADHFADYLARRKRLAVPGSGRLALSDDDFREMARITRTSPPARATDRTVGATADRPRSRPRRPKSVLAVGLQGEDRAQPAATRSSSLGRPFGSWPNQAAAGRALAYIDCAARVRHSGGVVGRRHMHDAYHSGDPYLAFAKQAHAVPHDATKKATPPSGNCSSSATLLSSTA